MWSQLIRTFALYQAFDAIFCNDAHEIVSRRGYEVLNEIDKNN
jgi:hypothetical protein